MKAILEKVPEQSNHSFSFEIVELPYFISSWHFHNEVEINLVQKGTGNLFVGDNISKFAPGTLIMLGKGLHHALLNDKEHKEPDSKLIAKSTVIKFSENIFGANFMQLPEMTRIKNIIAASKRGIAFEGGTFELLAEKIENIEHETGYYRIRSLLDILDIMSRSSEKTFLASEGYTSKNDYQDCERIDKVYKFVMDNFHRPIELQEVADISNLSPSAFCRYFKSRTTKTFSQFLNEVRIGYACKLLIEKKHTPLEICYKSGYNYPSNFHKQFKILLNMTPLEYQKKFWNNASAGASTVQGS